MLAWGFCLGLLTTVVVATVNHDVPTLSETAIEEHWAWFKQTFNKSYASTKEENFRKEVFLENLQKIHVFNKEYILGWWAFSQKLNSFADLLHHEFNKALNGFKLSLSGSAATPISRSARYITSANVIFPSHIDWREVGAVSSVKNQQLCASCWAFSAVGSLEGQNFRKNGSLIEMSPQNLIDCSRPQGNDGCGGGLVDPAFEYVKQNQINMDAAYPYEARDGRCRFNRDAIAGDSAGFVNISPGSESELEAAVATVGPISVAMNAGRPNFQFYADGIYYDTDCGNTYDDVNHAVLVVGYGVEPNGQKYWLIKNSYGEHWGIGGYFKLAKDQNNHCGVAVLASFPLV